MRPADLAERAAVLALTSASSREWYRTAALTAEAGSAEDLLGDTVGLMSEEHRGYAAELRRNVSPDDVDRAASMIQAMTEDGLRLLTILDEDYPSNLRLVYNRPPFIWVKGGLDPADFRAVAVVGTRQATADGVARARRITAGLVRVGVTIVSGLARGIDTAAHTAALDCGGRTIAVVGHGLRVPVYPRENADLADRIAQDGAIVSQFWPDAPPRRVNSPQRNVVMSGLAMGTVVVEASETSGAKMQARFALEHGKRLFLLESLLAAQEWAQRYAERPGVTVVREVEDVVGALDEVEKAAKPAEQLTLRL